MIETWCQLYNWQIISYLIIVANETILSNSIHQVKSSMAHRTENT